MSCLAGSALALSMNMPNLELVYYGIGTFLVGLLCLLIPKRLAAWFDKISRSIRKRSEEIYKDWPFKPSQFRMVGDRFFEDQAKGAMLFRWMGIVLMIMSVISYILAAVSPNSN